MNSFQSLILFLSVSYYSDKKMAVCLFIFLTYINLLMSWNLLYMHSETMHHFFSFWMSFNLRLFLLGTWVEQLYDCRSFQLWYNPVCHQSFLPESVPNSFSHVLHLASCRKSPFFNFFFLWGNLIDLKMSVQQYDITSR